jgi:SAM-dependent methyltransferase/uncharacterized protein YbaR (Trm112 family)
VKQALLDILASPADRGSLSLGNGAAADSDLESGTLVAGDGDSFEIREGVPRMAPSEEAPGQDGTMESFGAKWSTLRPEQRDRLSSMQYRWFDERYGFGDEEGLRSHLEGVGSILDAGTGPGLHAARFARLSDAQVVGMDLSESVGDARRNHGDAENLHYVQGDILRPPFAPETFELVVSDQVIHHTPDCHGAFLTLAELVKPGGELMVYVYVVKPLLRELADTHVREVTTKMSVEECREFSDQVTELGRELSATGAKVKLEKGVPLLGIEPGEHDVQRLIYWTFFKCFWSDDLGEELSSMVNFDWYHPPYASRHTEPELREWAAEAGLQVTHVDVIESGISIRARRP